MLPAMVVRHTDDIVPALGGAQSTSGRAAWSGDAFAAGDRSRTTSSLPAHQRSYLSGDRGGGRRGSSAAVRADSPRLDAFTARVRRPRPGVDGHDAGT